MANIKETYASYEAALAAIGAGYDDSLLAEVIAFKTDRPWSLNEALPEAVLNAITAVAVAAASVTARPLRVIDFGGGCGTHRFAVARALGLNVRWAIVETPAMVEQARKIARGRFSAYSDLRSALTAIGGADLIFASGSVQYTPRPDQTLRDLAGAGARHLVLARFPLWRGATTVGIQRSMLSGNGIGALPEHISDLEVAYPITFIDQSTVHQAFHLYRETFRTHSSSADYNVAGIYVLGSNIHFVRN